MSKRSYYVKKTEWKRKALSIEVKLEIIKRFERNERTCDIVRATGINEATLRTIRRNAEKIKQSAICGTTNSTAMTIRTRPREMEEMEKLLSIWIESETKKNSAMTFLAIKQKALEIYEEVKSHSPNPAEVMPFSASSGWFSGFKNRHIFQNLHMMSETACVDEQTAKEFSLVIKRIIEEGGYTLDQVFNFDETGLYLKRIPSKYLLSKIENNTPGFLGANDRVSVTLGANASGELKLKPLVIYHNANPKPLKGLAKSELGVYYKHSKKGWMTPQVCLDIFSDSYIVDIENYCKQKNIPFKALIIMDNTPSYPLMIAELNTNVKFIFLPPNSRSYIQPFDQGVITLFKANYLRQLFMMLNDANESESINLVIQFWKKYNLKMAIDNIVEAWNDISQDFLHRVWRKLIPDLVIDSEGFDSIDLIKLIISNCVHLARQVGFDEIEYKQIKELLAVRPVDLSIEQLQKILEDADFEIEEKHSGELNPVQLTNVLTEIEKQLQWLEDNDYNTERSRIVTHEIRDNLEPYRHLIFETSTNVPKEKLNQGLENDEPLPSTSGVRFQVKREKDSRPPSPISQ